MSCNIPQSDPFVTLPFMRTGQEFPHEASQFPYPTLPSYRIPLWFVFLPISCCVQAVYTAAFQYLYNAQGFVHNIFSLNSLIDCIKSSWLMLKMYLTPTQQIQNSIGNQIINHSLSLCFSDSLCLSLFSLTSLFSLLYGKTCIHTRMTFTLTNPSLQNLCFMHPKRGFPDCVFSTFLCVSFPVLSRSKIFQQQEKKKFSCYGVRSLFSTSAANSKVFIQLVVCTVNPLLPRSYAPQCNFKYMRLIFLLAYFKNKIKFHI